MSISTTSTTTFDLLKYSRAYSQATELEWQHFVNPVIRLMLDTTKATDGQLNSYRIRIIWVFSTIQESMDVDRREVTFEDLDLLSYSTLPARQAAQGMPLKAVYQGAVVGLRYQFPCVPVPGTTPQYRRFQITFTDEISATNFIDCIRFVCPCKANPAPPARITRPLGIQSSLATSGRTANTSNSQHALPGKEVSKMLQPSTATLLSSPSSTSTMDHHALGQTSQARVCALATPVSGPWSASTFSVTAQHPSNPSHSDALLAPSSVQGSASDAETSFPSSSLPSSSPPPVSRQPPRASWPVLMPPPPVPAQMSLPPNSQSSQATPTSTPSTVPSATLAASEPSSSVSTLKSNISATLRDSHGLYTLSKDELEKLVAEVLREEGFAELMNALDGMWKIRGISNIHT